MIVIGTVSTTKQPNYVAVRQDTLMMGPMNNVVYASFPVMHALIIVMYAMNVTRLLVGT